LGVGLDLAPTRRDVLVVGEDIDGVEVGPHSVQAARAQWRTSRHHTDAELDAGPTVSISWFVPSTAVSGGGLGLQTCEQSHQPR
jgi:hypothetical protein